ncbi:MAG TPA: hypothetical protein PKI03_04180 [Pseudomonadota bacterium]|nr:hypothetical protein [Pseudomonadota bacterium]
MPARRDKPANHGAIEFHFLRVLEDEYQTLFAALRHDLPRQGYEVKIEPLEYAQYSVKHLETLFAAPRNVIVETPLHSGARFFSDSKKRSHHKVIGSSFTFTAARSKVVACTLARDPQRDVQRLLCASFDSMATQLVRYYAVTHHWDLEKLDANTQETGTYGRLLDVLETLCGSPAAEMVLRDCVFVLSGQRVIERMEALAKKYRDQLAFQIHYDVYAQAKETTQRALFGSQTDEVPDLPGTVLIAHPDVETGALTAFMTCVAEWGERHELELRAAGMARPQAGTPTAVVGTVVFTEQMAHAFAQSSRPLATFDYNDFQIAPVPARWLQQNVRSDAAKAIHAAVTHVLTSLLDAEREAAENFVTYFAGATQRHSPASRFLALREAIRELALFYSTIVAELPGLGGGGQLRDRITALRGRLTLAPLAHLLETCTAQQTSELDTRTLSPQIIRAAFAAIVAIKGQQRELFATLKLVPTTRRVSSEPQQHHLVITHPDDARLTLRLSQSEYASKQLTAPGKAPILRLLFYLLRHGKASTRPLVREALGYDYVVDPQRKVLGRNASGELKANTFYSYCQRLREFFPFIQSDHKGGYAIDYEAARRHLHADEIARLRIS